MARKAASYSCPFDNYTGEKRPTAQAHFKKHAKRITGAKYVIKDVHVDLEDGNAGFHASAHESLHVKPGLYTVYLVPEE